MASVAFLEWQTWIVCRLANLLTAGIEGIMEVLLSQSCIGHVCCAADNAAR